MRSFYVAETPKTHLLRLLLASLPLDLALSLRRRQLLLRRLHRLPALDALLLLLPHPLALRDVLLLAALLDPTTHRLLALLERLLRLRLHQMALVAVADDAGRVLWLAALGQTGDVRHQLADVARLALSQSLAVIKKERSYAFHVGGGEAHREEIVACHGVLPTRYETQRTQTGRRRQPPPHPNRTA